VRSVRLLAGQKAPRAVQRLGELLEASDPRIVITAAMPLRDRAGVTPLEVPVVLGARNPLEDIVATAAPNWTPPNY
jgi:hypothetical protein